MDRHAMSEPTFNSQKTLKGGQTWFLAVSALAVILMFVFVILPYVGKKSGSSLSGETAQDFDLELLSGGATGDRIRLSDMRGRTVLIDFWASWCKPCDEQRVYLAQAAGTLGERARILGIATSDERGPALAQLSEQKTSYSNAYDKDGLVGRAYRIEQLPTLILIDPKGHIRGRYSEVLSKERIEEIVAQLEAK